jgi:hypothetical protein
MLLNVSVAFDRINVMMEDLLSHWDNRCIVPLFVNPFVKVHLDVSAVSLVVSPRDSYGQISNLVHFFAQCCSISHWAEGDSFPPSDFSDPAFNTSGINKYVVQSWYLDFYD